MAGRPAKLTPRVQASLVRDLKAGLTRACACVRAGITYATLKTWVHRGRKGGKDNAAYSTFLAAVKKAEQDAVARNVGVIQKAARKTWQAAAWWLERKAPQDWARTERQEVTGKGGKAIQHDHNVNVRLELAPYADAFRDLVRGELGPCGEDVHRNGAQEPADPA